MKIIGIFRNTDQSALVSLRNTLADAERKGKKAVSPTYFSGPNFGNVKDLGRFISTSRASLSRNFEVLDENVRKVCQKANQLESALAKSRKSAEETQQMVLGLQELSL